MIKNKNEFKFACKDFLSGFPLNALRSYGREIGVSNPTKDKKKNILIEEIVLVLSGEVPPQAPSRLGAPVKNDFVDPRIQEGINRICMMYTENEADDDPNHLKEQFQKLKENPHMLVVEDPNARELEKNGVPEVYVGQLETLNGVSVLLPLNCMDSSTKIIVSVEMIRAFDLREGDVISCYAEKRHSVLVATTVLKVNGYPADSLRRGRFDDCTACYPYQKLNFHDGKNATIIAKLLQWLIGVGKGQRGLVLAPPKSGKSMLLLEMANLAVKFNKGLTVMTLLIDQAPEAVGQFRKIVEEDNLVYTTYEEDPERQVFVSEFILKRAKRYAESGRDVLLIVDSFNALSRAFNDTDASLGGKVLAGGLESKTLHYLKRYFGTARCLERGGSLTVIGSLSVDTGNPVDDVLGAELSNICNLEICLSDELAKRRIYPALDLLKTRGKGMSQVSGIREEILNAFIRNDYLPVFGIEGLYELLSNVSNLNELEDKASKQLKEKKR